MRLFFRQSLAAAAAAASLALACPATAQQNDDFSPPPDYYAPAEGLTETALRSALHEIIDDHNALDYDAMRTAPRVLDVDPGNPDNILLLYSGDSIPGHLFNSQWNREHLWPQSYGADTDYIPGTDFHHLFPADPGVNSARSNLLFDYTNPLQEFTHPDAPGSTYDANSWEPRDEDKGRVARAMLYMDLRYEQGDVSDFILAETANRSQTTFGKLSVLLEWNRLYPPDDYELRRNHLIHTGFSFSRFSWQQGNRNPFVDFPFLAEALHGPDNQTTRGAWLWQHFSPAELAAGSIASDQADPDGDLLPNLIEYSADLDPRNPGTPDVLEVFTFPGFGTRLTYHRQKAAAFSGVMYHLERSSSPLREETWSVIPEEAFTAITITDRASTETIVANLPAASTPTWYRLRVTRQQDSDTASSALYDPVRIAHPERQDSIFLYEEIDPATNNGLTTWMGSLNDSLYPWVHHQNHGWLHFAADRDDAVWFHDHTIGWCFTSSDLYPFLFHLDSNSWLYFLRDSASPNRWFHHPEFGWLPQDRLPSSDFL